MARDKAERARRELERLLRLEEQVARATRGLRDVDRALEEYERVLKTLDPVEVSHLDEVERLNDFMMQIAEMRRLLGHRPEISEYLGSGGLETAEVQAVIERIERDLDRLPLPEAEGETPSPEEVRDRRQAMSRDRDRHS